jgi:imidazolonepropionase-like amidohydrolase
MRLVIEAGRVIDGVSDQPLYGMDVVVDDDRISAVVPHGTPLEGPLDGPSVRIIDGREGTLLPGLVDAHAHYTFDPTEGSLQVIAERRDAEILAAAERHAAVALRAGITTARGAGSIRGLELVLRNRIAAGLTPGPRIVAAGTAIGAPDGHGIAFGVGARGAAALTAATNAVLDQGADVVKIVASEAAMLTTTGHADARDVFGRPELDEAEVRAIVDAAHARGRRVMAHAQDSESVSRCARAASNMPGSPIVPRSRRWPTTARPSCRRWP